MNRIIQTINGYLWGLPMIAFLFLTHLFMTVKTGFIQRKTLRAIRLSAKSSEGHKGDISPFQSLATTLASTLGTGNIVGVGTAVALGGAGAVFWCWITGVFGMATQYAECLLSVRYRVKNQKGEFSGGPMYVLSEGLNSKPLGMIYAILAGVCGLLTGASIQSNAIAGIIKESTGDRDRYIEVFKGEVSLTGIAVGVVLSLLTALVVFGGVKKISQVCSFFVPVMAVAYTGGCVAVLFINRSFLADSLVMIIREAFSLRSVSSGAVGGAMLLACRYGVARGLFSNEAGLGTSSVVSASANTPNPVRQGLVSMTATFWDTVVMCLVTGLVIVSTCLAEDSISMYCEDGGFLCFKAFSRLPKIGEGLLVFGMITFAFSTILGWCFTGEKCAEFVMGEKGAYVYRYLWVAAVLVSPVISFDMVWNLADLFNALLAVPNVYSLVMLSGEVHRLTQKYIDNPERVTEKEAVKTKTPDTQ